MRSSHSHTGMARRLGMGVIIPMVVMMALTGVVMLVTVRSNLDELMEQNAAGTLALVGELVDSEFTGSVRSYLRGRGETARDLLAWHHQQFLRGEISEGEAYRRGAEVLLDEDFGRIGTTGYLAAVSTQGILEIHPLSPGVDASGAQFMQEAMAMRNGYLEYEWQNVGETEARMKAGYLAYFEPWDLMVWASSYKSEFLDLLDHEGLHERIAAIPLDHGGYVLLVDDDRQVRAGEDAFGVMASWMGELSDSTVQFAQTPGGRVRMQSRQEDVLGWSVVTVIPMRRYDRLTTFLRVMVLVSVATTVLLMILVIRLMIVRTLRPMQVMKHVVEQVTSGDLTGTVPVNSGDEIGEIAGLFNRLVQEFSTVLQNIASVIAVLSEAVQSLSTSTQEIASTSNEQAAAVKEVLSTMEDADRLSRGVGTKVDEVARIAGNTQENVERGFNLIKTSLGKMEEIRTTNSDTIAGIKTLGERIESIWDIVNIINGIADQTKIIAFNAELEAAAAGDAGRNFQIVAGEIRRLADSTVASTSEIKVKINEIQHASDKLIMASEEGTQRIREGWDVSNTIRGVFEEVLSSSEISAASAQEISRSMKMQVSSFEQIFMTLKQISESIDSFVESTMYTTEVTERLREISDSFQGQVARYALREENDG